MLLFSFCNFHTCRLLGKFVAATEIIIVVITVSEKNFLNRKLTSFDDWSSLCVHIAMDNTVIIDDISK